MKQELTAYNELPQFLAFSAGAEILASGSYQTIWLWVINPKIATWELRQERETNQYFRAIAFSPNDKILALVGPFIKMLWAIDLATAAIVFEKSVKSYDGGFDGGFKAVAFSPPDGKILALASYKKTILLWPTDPVTLTGAPEEMLRKLIGHDGGINAVAFSPSDSKILASFSDDRRIRLWAINPMTATGECIQELTSHSGPVSHVAFLPLDGKIFASAAYDETVRLWAIDPTTTTNIKSEPKHAVHKDLVAAAVFSPNDKVLASASYDMTIQLWAIDPMLANGVSKGALTGHSGPVQANSFSPPGGRILASASHDNTVRIWTVNPIAATGGIYQGISGFKSLVTIITFSPNGKTLALIPNANEIWLWTIDPMTAAWVLRLKFPDHVDYVYYHIHATAFSPDCRMLAFTASLYLMHWKVFIWTIRPAATTAELKEILEVHEPVKDISFSEDGGYIKTNIGNLPLSGYDEPTPNRDLTSQAYVDKDWIFRHKQRLLWLPPDYRASCKAFHNNIFVLGHYSGQVTFIGFNFSVTQL